MLRKLMVASTVALAITALSTPAQAGVRVGIGIGIPIGGYGYYGGYGYGPYYRPYPYYYYPYGPAPYYYPPAYAPAPVYAPGYPPPAGAYAPSPLRRTARVRLRIARAIRRTHNRRRPVRTTSRPPAQIISQHLTSLALISRRPLRDTARPVRRATRRRRVSLRNRRRCNHKPASGSGPCDRFRPRLGRLPATTAEPIGFSRVGKARAADPLGRSLVNRSGLL